MKKKQIITMAMIIAFFAIVIFISGCSDKIIENNSATMTCHDCNVLFLNMELLRADYVDLISTEHGTNITPHIDEFFKNGIIFKDVTSAAGATAYSNMATMTGLDGFFVKEIFGNASVDRPIEIPPKIESIMKKHTSLAEIFHNNNYFTVNLNIGSHSGKNVFLDRGFDKYSGKDSSLNDSIYPRTVRILKAIPSDKKYFMLIHPSKLNGNIPFELPANITKINNSKIVYFYNKTTKTYFMSYQIHKNGSLIHDDFVNEDNYVVWMNDSMYNEYLNVASQAYAQKVNFIDSELKQIFDYLKSSGELNNTIVVLYANHGDGLYEHYIRAHGTPYQSDVHVPLLIRYPGLNKQINITTPVSLIDLEPTIFDMLGIQYNSGDSSKISLIQGGNYSREYLFGINPQNKYVRHNDIKLLTFADGHKELYNITADPNELNDIAVNNSATIKALSDVLLAHEIVNKEKFREQNPNTPLY